MTPYDVLVQEQIDALRAENEELRKDKQRRLEERRELRNEIAAAEAEVGRLEGEAVALAEIIERTNTLGEQRRTEGERLAKQAAYEKARADRLEASAEALRAEVERLRTLEAIIREHLGQRELPYHVSQWMLSQR